MTTSYQRNDEPPWPKPGDGSDNSNTGAAHRGIELQKKLAEVSRLAGQLNRSVSSQPRLTGDSHIWPETEDQYAIKEEGEAELLSEVETLRGYMPLLERDVRHNGEALQRIQDDSGKLNLQEPRECYSQAEEAARRQYLGAVHDRDTVAVVLVEAQAVLDVSREKKFPGKDPVRQFPFPGAKPGEMPDSDERSDEMDGLISLGPLGQVRE